MVDCKKCKYWHNKQRELDYDEDYGICSFSEDYNEYKEQIRIIPHENLSYKLGYENMNNDGSLKLNEYEYRTHFSFGCNRGLKND